MLFRSRVLRNDFTVAFNSKLYQIEDNIRAGKVVVEERIDGSMIIARKDRVLKFKEIARQPKKAEKKPRYAFKIKTIYRPPEDHPWRRFKINSQYTHYSQREKVAPKEKGLLLTSKH